MAFRVMHPNDAEGIANSIDPDQTAFVGLVCPNLRNITVVKGLKQTCFNILNFHTRRNFSFKRYSGDDDRLYPGDVFLHLGVCPGPAEPEGRES